TAPLLPLLSKEFNTSTEQSGWFVSAYALGYAVFALIAGPLSDRIDRRRIILTGSIGFTLFTGLCGLAWGFWSLFTARFLAGVFASLISPQIWASIPMTVPKQAIIKTMGYATAGLAIAQIAGIPVGSFLSTYGWQIPFFAVAAASLLLLGILYSRFPSIPPVAAAQDGNFLTPYLHVLKAPSLLLSLLAYLIFQTGVFASLSFIGSWFARDFGASQTTIGFAMLVIGCGNALGSLIGSRFVAYIGMQKTMLMGLIALSIVYLSVSLTANFWTALGIFALALFLGGIMLPILMGELQSHTATARGTVSSLSNTAMYAGTTISGAVGGTLLTQFPGYSGIAVMSACAIAISLGVYALGGAFRPKNGESF
uniref:MFS transporter n=1 Tax=Rothia aeria TaxID=172042 RepID=UPI003C7CB1DE